VIPDSRPVRDLARAISRLERGTLDLSEALTDLGLTRRGSFVVGVTGPPGSGKSTLVDRLVGVARRHGQRVAIVAVDPSSPFTGGAILGDRVRMMAHTGDQGVFIRSMAARRALGGLAATTRDVVQLLEAAGYDLVIVETVGVGQSELDIVQTADSVLVITVPGLGDSIQTLKAGLLEIADIFVVNMADRPGLDRTLTELRAMLHLGRERAWTPPIVPTVASEGEGVEALWDELARHRQHLEQSGELAARRQRRLQAEVLERVDRTLRERVRARVAADGCLRQALQQVAAGQLDPRAAADRILATVDAPSGSSDQ
jgi:LAO/AO transport system kinase